jgi:hypothetical protein
MKIPLIGIKMSAGTLALGVLAIMAAPQILSALRSIIRPVAKAGIKGGMIAYGKGKDLLTETVDSVQKVASEAKSEISEESKATPKKKAA